MTEIAAPFDISQPAVSKHLRVLVKAVLIERGLDEVTQEMLITLLRRREPDARALFMKIRSSAILELASVGGHETIGLCPSSHGPPLSVTPYLGAPGYESVAACLASPSERLRTEGAIA